MGESRLRVGSDKPTKFRIFRDTQQTARFLSSQAKRLDVLDVSVFIVLFYQWTFVGDRDELTASSMTLICSGHLSCINS